MDFSGHGQVSDEQGSSMGEPIQKVPAAPSIGTFFVARSSGTADLEGAYLELYVVLRE